MSIRKEINTPVRRAALGIFLQGVVWLLVVRSVFSAYDRFDRAVTLQGETEQLVGEFYGNLYSIVFFSGSLALIGFALTVEVAVRGQYRRPWFFWASLLFALPICILFPIGTLLGAGYMIYLVVKRKEFFALEESP